MTAVTFLEAAFTEEEGLSHAVRKFLAGGSRGFVPFSASSALGYSALSS